MVSRPKTPNRPKVTEKEISSVLDNVYRWEDNPSLNHSCSVCGVTLNNPRAKKTCLGVHAVPCMRYHQTLFRVGRAHSCEACKNSNEQHEKRHREIGNLIWQIKAIDGVEAMVAQQRRKAQSGELASTPEPESTDEQECMAPPKGENSRKPVLSVRIPNNGNVTGVPPSAIVSASPCSSKAKEIRLQKQAARASKNIDKALKRQRGYSITSASRDFTEEIHLGIHGHPKMPPTVDHGESGKALVTEIKNFQDLQLQLQHRGNQSKASEALRLKRRRANTMTKRDGLDTDIITGIICDFGIKPPFNEGTKERQRLLQELGSSIISDIEIVANEAKETLSRKEGYWRYANKRTYNEMVRNNELVNWETGEKLRELDMEDSHSEDSTEEAGGENLEVSPEYITGETDIVKQDMSTTQEDLANDSTKAHIDERNLVLTKSPGMLTLSLAPRKEKPRVNAAKSKQAKTDKPDISMQQEADQEGSPVIEPIITHKRRSAHRINNDCCSLRHLHNAHKPCI